MANTSHETVSQVNCGVNDVWVLIGCGGGFLDYIIAIIVFMNPFRFVEHVDSSVTNLQRSSGNGDRDLPSLTIDM